MIYYSCLTCPPHTTRDHDDRGKGACLMNDCPCKKMVEGEVFVRAAYVKLSPEEAKKAAAKRREEGLDE